MFSNKKKLWFYSKDEATEINADAANTNNFKSFKYKAKLLRIAVAQDTPNQVNGILKNATNAVPLKYLSYSWRSLEMPLSNCKIELKIKWAKSCALSANYNDIINGNVNANNIICTIKHTKVYICSNYNFISKR